MLDVFGANVSTVRNLTAWLSLWLIITEAHGQDWQRQRKVIGTVLTERTHQMAWKEALQQARQMIAFWKGAGEIRSTAADSRMLALNVLVSAGYGKSYAFKGSSENTEDSQLTYRDSLGLILENALLILALGPDLISRITFPTRLARIGQAIGAFKEYMTQDFEEAKNGIAEKCAAGENLMTNLVQASVAESDTGDGCRETSRRKAALSRSEVFGNMFVFNFAGHDTTTHTLTYTFYLLAVNPSVQDWMSEEIRHVFSDDDISSWKYDSFPRLNRCLAVLVCFMHVPPADALRILIINKYETLRLYNPLLSIIKGTQNHATDLTIDGKSYIIPPNTRIILNLNAVHTHPRYWGDDSLEWKPSRWIRASKGNSLAIDQEYIFTPPRGAFMGWSDGKRACPGKKFGQVEHAAVMAALFRNHRVGPAKLEGEDMDQARKRAADCIADSGMRLLFQMLPPESVALIWSRRCTTQGH